MTFGKLINGSPCSDITVNPFTKVCSYPEPAGTTPLTLEVPVPRFSVPVPPSECACFTFTPGEVEKDVDVVPNCNGESGTAKCSIEIKPVTGTDCCDGTYKITPVIDVSVPCVPFDLGDGSVTVHNKSGDALKGTDGTVTTLSLERGEGDDCCTVTPHIDITFPDCIKHKPDSISSDDNGVQVTYCSRVSGGGVETKNVTDFITLKHDPDSCTYYPEVKKLELPCCTQADAVKSGTIRYTDKESYINWTLSRTDCDYDLKFDPHIPCKCLTFTGGTATATQDDDCSVASISIAIEKVGTDCCDATYKITPEICVPKCSQDNVEQKNRFSIGNGGYVDWKFTLTDCVPSIEFDAHPKDVTVNLPCPPTIEVDTKRYINFSFKNSSGNEETTKSGEDPTDTRGASVEFKKVEDSNGCCKYHIELGTLDLTDIEASINNGGVVYSGKAGSRKGKLYIDGTANSSTVWYGGGYGDKTESDADNIFKRGPSMGTTLGVTADLEIPTDDNVKPKIISTSNSTAYMWRSKRKTELDNGGNEVEDVEDWMDGLSVATGDLNVALPTGMQWHKRGIAAIMSQFIYNESGVLSYMSERMVNKNENGNGYTVGNGSAVLLAPAHSVMLENKVPNPDKPAGGLKAIYSIADKQVQSTGLTVYDGRGLRIHGATKSSDLTKDTKVEEDIGKLEIYPYDSDMTFSAKGELILNDKKGTTTVIGADGTNGGTIRAFNRGGDDELVLPVMTIPYIKDIGWWNAVDNGLTPDTSTILADLDDYYGLEETEDKLDQLALLVEDIVSWMTFVRGTFLHVARSGVILGTDGTYGEFSGTRVSSPKQQSGDSGSSN